MTDQAGFLSAVLDPERAVPNGLCDPAGRSAGKRFDVYRNNVAVSLTEALETGFPVVRKLVGDRFFGAMAGVFLRAHPPTSPVLALYGAALPEFLETFPPAATLAYLPDVARLELALRRAYHAADPPGFDARALAALPPERLMAAALTLSPAVQVLPSRWPVYDIWRANTEPDAPAPGGQPQTVLITRPQFDPVATQISAADAAFIAALADGTGLGDATQAAGNAAHQLGAEFDLSALLGQLLELKAITSVTERPPHE